MSFQTNSFANIKIRMIRGTFVSDEDYFYKCEFCSEIFHLSFPGVFLREKEKLYCSSCHEETNKDNKLKAIMNI